MDEPSNETHRQNHHHHSHDIGLNKLSHKIAKPSSSASTSSDHHHHHRLSHHHNHQRHPEHKPPVYTIDKNDFRNVVQKLTGYPPVSSGSSFADPPPIRPPKHSISRLQMMKPPPILPPPPVRPTSREESEMGFFPNPVLNATVPSPTTAAYRFLLASPPCSVQVRSPGSQFPEMSPKLKESCSGESGFPFSPSAFSGVLTPSSPGFLRLPVTTSK